MQLATEYIAAQITLKIVAAVGALLLVNILPMYEYGLYTLLLSCFSFLVSFSDLGATGSLLYFWRRSGVRFDRFCSYLGAVFRIKRTLFWLSSVAMLVYLATIWHGKTFDALSSAVDIVLIGIAAWSAFHAATWVFAFRLSGRLRQAYAVELSGETTKVLAIAIMWQLAWTSSTAAAMCTMIGAAISAYVATKYSSDIYGDVGPARKRAGRLSDRAVRSQTLPTVPWSLFIAAQGPLLTWLAAYYGSIVNLAEVGAIGRLGAILAVVSSFTISILVPRLGNVRDPRKHLIYYLLWLAFLLSSGGAMLAIIWAWPQLLLLLVGEQYKALDTELLLASVTAVVMTLEYFAGATNRARGWIGGQGWRIGAIVLAQIFMILFLDFRLTSHVLLFGLGTAIVAWLSQLVVNLNGMIAEIRMVRTALEHPGLKRAQ